MRAYVDGLRRRLAREERGMQAIEWVGVGSVAVALSIAVGTAMGASGLVEQIIEALETFVEQLQFQPITPVGGD